MVATGSREHKVIRFEIPGAGGNLVTLPDGWIPLVPPEGVAFLATEPNHSYAPMFNATVEAWVPGARFNAPEFVSSWPSAALLTFSQDDAGEWHLIVSHLIGNQTAVAEQRSFHCGDLRITTTLTLVAADFSRCADDANVLLQRPADVESVGAA
jgi:hypothetical protein